LGRLRFKASATLVHCDTRACVVSVVPSLSSWQTHTSERSSLFHYHLDTTHNFASIRTSSNQRISSILTPYRRRISLIYHGHCRQTCRYCYCRTPTSCKRSVSTNRRSARQSAKYHIGHLSKLLVQRQDRRPHKDNHHPAFNPVVSPASLSAWLS
jgi:hypothetical protein